MAGATSLGTGGSQRHGGEHIIGQPVGHLGNHIGGGRRNEHEIRRVGQRHMGHIILEIAVEGIHNAAPVGQRFKYQRCDELGGVLRHQHMHIRPHLDQRMGHIGHFVCGDAPGNPDDDRLSFEQHRIHRPFPVWLGLL